MNELLKELGLVYYFSRSVVSVPDRESTEYAYQMRCKVGLGKKMPRSIYQPSNDAYIDFTWLAKLGYLGLR